MVVRTVDKEKLKLIIVSENEHEIWAFCPFHNDRNRANLLLNKTGPLTGFYKCFGCGAFGSIKKVFGMDIASNKYRKSRRSVRPIDWVGLMKYYEELGLQSCKRYYLAGEWDVDSSVLSRLHIGWDGECFTYPMRNKNFCVVGMQRRYSNGSKKCVSGSRLGLIIPRDIDFTDVVIVCEGAHDTATVLDLGFNAIGRPGAMAVINETAAVLDGCYVAIIPDNDEPGVVGARRLAKEVVKTAKKCAIFNMRNKGDWKDISIWVNQEGKEVVRDALKNIMCNMKEVEIKK